MQAVVPSYLEQTMNTFMGEQERMRAQFSELIGNSMDMMNMPKSVDGAVKLMKKQRAVIWRCLQRNVYDDAFAEQACIRNHQRANRPRSAIKRRCIAEMRDQIAAMQKDRRTRRLKPRLKASLAFYALPQRTVRGFVMPAIK